MENEKISYGTSCNDNDCMYKVPNKNTSIFGINPIENILTKDGASFIIEKYISKNLNYEG